MVSSVSVPVLQVACIGTGLQVTTELVQQQCLFDHVTALAFHTVQQCTPLYLSKVVVTCISAVGLWHVVSCFG